MANPFWYQECSGVIRLWSGRVLMVVVTFAAMLADARAQGGGVWNTIGPTGGAITTLLTSPISASTLYAGTLENGVFVSTDAASTWGVANAGLRPSTATGRQTLYTIHALVTDGQYLYAATAAGLYVAAVSDAPTWSALATTGSATPITLLAFDPSTRRLFAASGPTNAATAPAVYVATIAASSPPAPVWSVATLPAAAGTPIGAMALVAAQGALTPAALMVGVGANLYTASVTPSSTNLSWVDADPSATLQPNGAITALNYSPDFLQAYACGSGVVSYSGNPFDAQPVWLPANLPASNATANNCAVIMPVPFATGAPPAILLGTDQGAFVSNDGVNFAATASLGAGAAANAFAVGAASGSTASVVFVGADYGVDQLPVPSLAGGAGWTPSNGPASVGLGGTNRRLNNANIVDSAILGTTLYGAATANGYVEVFSSSDSGATWTTTNIGAVLNAGQEIIALMADRPNSVLYAATTQGLLAYARSTSRWTPVGAVAIVGRVGALALGTSSLFVGTNNGVFAVPLGGAPGGALPVAAGLAGGSVRSLLAAGGNVYAGTIDPNDDNFVFSTTEASAAVGTAVWSPYGATSAGTDRITSLLSVGGNLLASTSGHLVLYASPGSAWSSANTSSDPAQQISDTFGVVNSLYSDGSSIYAATGSNGVFVSPAGTTFSWTAFTGTGTTALQSLEIHSLRANGSTLYAATAAGIATTTSPTSPTSPPPVVAQAPAAPTGSGGGAIDPLFGILLLLAGVVSLQRRDRF